MSDDAHLFWAISVAFCVMMTVMIFLVGAESVGMSHNELRAYTDYVSGCEKMNVTPEPPKFYRTEEQLETEETEELR